eukprot:scaffold2448_cov348-Alexandrium_tamarense.AAC.1
MMNGGGGGHHHVPTTTAGSNVKDVGQNCSGDARISSAPGGDNPASELMMNGHHHDKSLQPVQEHPQRPMQLVNEGDLLGIQSSFESVFYTGEVDEEDGGEGKPPPEDGQLEEPSEPPQLEQPLDGSPLENHLSSSRETDVSFVSQEDNVVAVVEESSNVQSNSDKNEGGSLDVVQPNVVETLAGENGAAGGETTASSSTLMIPPGESNLNNNMEASTDGSLDVVQPNVVEPLAGENGAVGGETTASSATLMIPPGESNLNNNMEASTDGSLDVVQPNVVEPLAGENGAAGGETTASSATLMIQPGESNLNNNMEASADVMDESSSSTRRSTLTRSESTPAEAAAPIMGISSNSKLDALAQQQESSPQKRPVSLTVISTTPSGTAPTTTTEKQQLDKNDEEDDEYDDIPPHILQQSTIVEKSPAERYIRFKEKLGSGAYKDVYRAYDTIEGIEVAWNVVKLGGVPKAERIRIVNEVRLLERLHHPNIISFHGSWVNRETERVIFVTEILSSGTLKSFVQKVQLIRWKIFKRWAIQILKGLEYLHSQDPPIIHRDLKCDNIFINGTSGDLRIGDFGLSTAISKKNQVSWFGSLIYTWCHFNSCLTFCLILFQPLSVLGTPEFMAPELYDENYNEKVDVYAFGMLLLEIITNQVPYHECTNPAQIYKKVTQGIPPASLRRVKSENARNFILLCLGIGKDASERPSATELLNHQFLVKRADDDNTIEVEPAIEDMVIDESKPFEGKSGTVKRSNSLTLSDTGSDYDSGHDKNSEHSNNNKYASSIDGHELPSRGGGTATPSEQVTPREEPKDREATTDDQFGEMPENEANMKRVTVLMGRGTALDDDEPPSHEMGVISLSEVPHHSAAKGTMSRSVSEAETSSVASVPQYKVSALPKSEAPYQSDEINLALTLPDEGQTTIEFDFDLVNDDPVQVAREMVMELDEVPDDAVLDISEAISGVARQARMKHNQWAQMQNQQQNTMQQNMFGIGGGMPNGQQQQGMMMHPQGGMMQPQGMQPQGMMMPQQQQQGLGGQMMYGSGFQQGGGFQTPGGTIPQQQQQQMGFPSSGNLVQQHLSEQQQQPQHLGFQSSGGTMQPQLQPQVPTQQYSQPHAHVEQQQQVPPPPPASTPQLTPQYQPQQALFVSNSMDTASVSNDVVSAQRTAHTSLPGQIQPQQNLPAIQQDALINGIMLESNLEPVTQNVPIPISSIHGPYPSLAAHQNDRAPLHPPPQMPVPEETTVLDDDIEDDSEVDTEEIRRLEHEFEKKLQRAKKSYGTRMDNLHRSKEEAEAQHQMTLEKHEKERIEFEKRVRLAEEEQNRRLSQIEKEFKERKHQVRQQRHPGVPPNGERPPLHGGHKRSSSHFDPSMHQAAASLDHRRNNSLSDVSDKQQQQQQQQQPQQQSAPTATEQLPPMAPSSGGGSTLLGEVKNPVRQIESSPSLRERSGSTSS